MTDVLLQWLASHEGPLAYLALCLAAALEYIFPPFPGDTVTLFGVFLAGTAGFSPWLVYLAIDVGSILGGLCAYAVGRRIARDPEHPPRLLRGRRTQAALAEVRRRFERHGAIYLALNRFLPALRAFFFVGAGLARVPVSRVVLWGAVSASAWNALLFAIGWAVGGSWQRLSAFASTYAWVAMGVGVVVVVVFAYVVRARLRESRTR
jgi:membrane protein DedA with SNARE-associated domain